MPRFSADNNSRVTLRMQADDKALIMRAAAVAQTNMTEFITHTALQEARAVIASHERLKLSDHDSRLVSDLLEHPPAPNAKLREAARALPKESVK